MTCDESHRVVHPPVASNCPRHAGTEAVLEPGLLTQGQRLRVAEDDGARRASASFLVRVRHSGERRLTIENAPSRIAGPAAVLREVQVHCGVFNTYVVFAAICGSALRDIVLIDSVAHVRQRCQATVSRQTNHATGGQRRRQGGRRGVRRQWVGVARVVRGHHRWRWGGGGGDIGGGCVGGGRSGGGRAGGESGGDVGGLVGSGGDGGGGDGAATTSTAHVIEDGVKARPSTSADSSTESLSARSARCGSTIGFTSAQLPPTTRVRTPK